MPLLISYGLMPLLDCAIGEDENNPPEAVVPQLENDRYYRWLTWATVPLHFVALIGCAWWAGTHDLSWWALLILAYVAGTDSGLGINTGHEFGHKHNADRAVAGAAGAGGPGLRTLHGRTRPRPPSVCVDARRPREFAHGRKHLPLRAARDPRRHPPRLAAGGRAPGTSRSFRIQRDNTMLQSYAVTAVLQVGLVIAFGWAMVPFLAVHNAVAWWQLTSANYVEHYGLLRERLPNGALRGAATAPLMEHQSR